MLLVRLTVSPPVGASPVSVTVPVVICPETTFAGLNETAMTTAGFTVRAAGRAVPLGNVAVMLGLVLAGTASVVTLNVPLLFPPAILKLAGTVAAPVLLLINVTVNPEGGAGPVSTSVPTDPVPPVTGFGLSVSDMMPAGLTTRLPLILLAPSVAVTITVFVVATPTVVAVNVCEELPPAMLTLAGTVTDRSELFNVTVTPPVGAGWLSVTVPVELVPPVTVPGLKLTPATVSEGTTVALPETVVPLAVAMTVTAVELATEPPVTMKVTEFEFAGTVTFAGVGKAVVLLLIRATVIPPAGATPVSVTVPVVICPETTFVGLKASDDTTGGFTVSGAVRVGPPLCVAVMVSFAIVLTAIVVTLNVPLEAPAAMATFAGTVAEVVSLLIRLIVTPPVGAGPVRFTVPMEVAPPVTVAGFNTTELSAAGRTVRVPAISKLEPDVAETITGVDTVTVAVVAVNVCELLPAGTVMPAGTVTIEGLALISETNTPPAGATALMLTVPVEVVPPVTFAGMKLTRTTGGGRMVTIAVTIVVPVVAVTVTVVDVLTGFAVTMKVCALLPAGILTEAGTGNAPGLLLVRLTVTPLAGAFPVRVTVPVDACPLATLSGLKDNCATAAGRIVRVLVLLPPFSDAVSVAIT